LNLHLGLLVYLIFLEVWRFLIVSFFNIRDLLADANFLLNFFLVTLNNFLARLILVLYITKYYFVLLYIQNIVVFILKYFLLIFVYYTAIFLFLDNDFSFLNILTFYLLNLEVFTNRFLFIENATLGKQRSLFSWKPINSFIITINQYLFRVH
jgi:hypothetical protein